MNRPNDWAPFVFVVVDGKARKLAWNRTEDGDQVYVWGKDEGTRMHASLTEQVVYVDGKLVESA